jgi:hypothetical protein
MPESMEMYPGTSGRTQGERKEINPARKAPARGTSCISVSFSFSFLFSHKTDGLFSRPEALSHASL